MSARNHTDQLVRRCEHTVQFFDTDESRAQNVAAFLAEGFAAGEPLVVVARPSNGAAIREELEARGVPVAQAIAAGMLTIHDAHEMVRRLTPRGMPDSRLFEELVAKPIRALAARGRRVRAYGEMVDILAQRGELPEAIALEHLWNTLGERVPLVLMCGYSAAHFVSTSTHAELLEICKAHTDVARHPQDPMAAWVLTAAHNGGAAGQVLHH